MAPNNGFTLYNVIRRSRFEFLRQNPVSRRFIEEIAKERGFDSHNVFTGFRFQKVDGHAMRIPVRLAFEFNLDGSWAGIGVAIIAAGVQIRYRQSALHLLQGIPRDPLFVLGLVPQAERNGYLRSIAFSMKLPSMFTVAELMLPVSRPALDAIFPG